MAGTERTRTWPLWVFGCAWPAAFLVWGLVANDGPRWVDVVTVILLVGLVVLTRWQARGLKRKAAASHRAP
ncbi:hypothetical protein GCM10009844_16890 [Nocardioides koreensis]|uniref:DUF2530 domain-containing protein n=1 Tax=Nocardioides koreensis TaxID=433651 RepID=A0ABN2ZL64_9ACTN